MDYRSNPLWLKLVRIIAHECEIEEVTAEFGASAVLAIPEIRDALELKANFPMLIREAESDAYRSAVIDHETRND